MHDEARACPRFLIVGLGGVGGVLAGGVEDAVALTTNERIAEAVRRRGLVVGTKVVSVRVTTVPPAGPFDFVLLATQPPDLEDAARRTLPALAPHGAFVCLPNGLPEERVARIAGVDRTLGAIVTWGAAMPAPGVVVQTARGGFSLGRLDGRADERLDVLARALRAVAPVEITRNLPGQRWSKLAVSCAVSSLSTLGGDHVGALLRDGPCRRLALEVVAEAVLVARSEGVRLAPLGGTIDLSWLTLGPREGRRALRPGLVAKHALLALAGLRYRRVRSSMLAAIERGRPPAVDFLNGEVVDRGRRHGVPTPVNAAIQDAIWRMARGQARPGLDLVRAVYDGTS